ncbi:MAG TPA: thiamine pyrophosphate-dependent enzyme [Chitinispirillaceae bacterium]|nr:thiamine pyrophosphate-dependent enzyme [Chitinispirillaceae bacterium]
MNSAQLSKSVQRYPEKMDQGSLYQTAYYYMYLSRRMEIKIKELFKKGHVKGTVILCNGNEATTVGMTLPFRSGFDIISLMQRDFAGHLVSGADPVKLMCQYMANGNSPTHGREGNVHHGDASKRRFPMISHLGNMAAPTVGAVWAARSKGEKVFGLTTIGDGGTSVGDIHESLNLASVRKVPVLFLIENNNYAYSTPTSLQYNCEKLSDRAKGYGIEGITIDGTDVWEVYSAVYDALAAMEVDSLPRIIECMTLRLEGHAVYDNAEYVSKAEYESWLPREPLARIRNRLLDRGVAAEEIDALNEEIDAMVDQVIVESLAFGRPSPETLSKTPYAPRKQSIKVAPFTGKGLRNQGAVNSALHYILGQNPESFICGQDIGVYGSAFKTCKGLIEKFGADRVIDMPICESATVGFCLGASQLGRKPIMEFQFADFSTEAVTQLGLNAGTWFFRTEQSAPMLVRLPGGGGITLGPFHSGEYEGLWSRFPGLKVFYPSTPQEHFEALVAGFYDPNPCLVFEHKKLYWGKQADVQFDGDIDAVFRPRMYCSGQDITIVAFGAMVETVLSAISSQNYSAEVWNPFILSPLEIPPILESIKKTGRLLVIQESSGMSGLGDHIITIAIRECFKHLKDAPFLLSAPDMPVPFARELEQDHIPDTALINETIRSLLGS